MELADLQRTILEDFSAEATQAVYRKMAEAGLWQSERAVIERFFPKGCRVLDVGCGTGRTTIPLHALGYRVLGVDLTPAMIANARAVAREKGLAIDYEVGDATALALGDASFDAALFSFNGLMQIPSSELRGRAMAEIARVLVPGGVFVFTARRRELLRLEWQKRFVKHFLLRPLGRPDPETEWGDKLWFREESRKMQFMHFASRREVARAVARAGFALELAETAERLGGTGGQLPTVFYVCRRR